MLSLKELPEDESDKSLTLSEVPSQGRMVTHEATKKRYEDGLAQVRSGNMAGFSKMLYSRAQNELLGLPEKSLDESTKVGIDMVKDLHSRVEGMAS
ncbi:hypothetical protein N7537_008433 [Penicillium hordei]|uniref:Uncharacterized protein n=1 Tax=Penicillium hordei TaxID=40994 RepID=A0AAD6E0Y8_9EURO|nr:uncharacterized protein N7537_008433 [Penicillium hordei]KAJ5598349.1 hypothetical protein N7537_008433 [Penicillium hordei]